MKNIHILVIDDDKDWRNNIPEFIRNIKVEGYQLIPESAEFNKAIELVKNNTYDIITLDLHERIDEKKECSDKGLQIITEIQKIQFIPIIFFTGFAGKIKNWESGIVKVINKSDGLDSLHKELEKFITNNLASLRIDLHNYIEDELKNYFWGIIHEKRDVLNGIEADSSLNYLLIRRLANSLSNAETNPSLFGKKTEKEKVHPIEFYIYPNNKKDYSTGEILRHDGTNYIIITPSCDFVRSKKRGRKAKKVQLIMLESLTSQEEYLNYQKDPSDKNHTKLQQLIQSRRSDQYYFLPGTPFIEASVVNFQNQVTVEYDIITKWERIVLLDDPYAQSMLSSFIRFHNRIGSPDIDSAFVIENIDK